MHEKYVLITGATGFIGSHVTERFLRDKSYRIVAVVRRTKNYKNVDQLRNNGAILEKGDFWDKELLDNLFQKFPIHSVIHIAALRGGGAGKSIDYFRVNVQGTETLLEASLKNKVKKFVFCSSVGVFGTIPMEVPASPNTSLNADSVYHRSKLLAEVRVNRFIRMGLNAYTVRPTITYGPGDEGFPRKLVELVKRRLLILPSKLIKIHLLDVMSFAELVKLIIESPELNERCFIAADNAPICISELADLIHFHYRGKSYPRFLKMPAPVFRLMASAARLDRSGRWLPRILLTSQNWYYDISKTVSAFNFVPAKTLKVFPERMFT